MDNLRTILRNNKREDNVDLYQHLVEVINHIIMNCPEEGISKFEEISFLLKNKDNYWLEDFLNCSVAKPYASTNYSSYYILDQSIKNARALFSVSPFPLSLSLHSINSLNTLNS